MGVSAKIRAVKAILVWVSGRGEPREGSGLSAVYELSGPAFEVPPEADHYIVAPKDEGEFAAALYGGKVSPERLRRFLSRCRLAAGGLSEELEYVLAREEQPLLPLLDAPGSVPPPPLPYDEQIECFFLDGVAVPVLPDVYRTILAEPEFFGTASVCEGCGEAEDAAVFLWTRRAGHAVRVNLLIQNQGGIWTCWIAPFTVPVPAGGAYA